MPELFHPDVRQILESEMALWVCKRIEALPEEARYSAANAVRNLNWAGGIATFEDSIYREGEWGFRVPATFLAMHAMEEAVTALVMSAKCAGFGRLARDVNIHDHYHKTTLAWVCGQVVEMVREPIPPKLGYDPARDAIILLIEEDEKKFHQIATLSLLGWLDEDGNPVPSLAERLYERNGGKDKVAEIVKFNGSARNKLMYASKHGFNRGPDDLVRNLVGMSTSIMGVLWAAVDITENAEKAGKRAQIAEVVLRTTAELKRAAFPPRQKVECPAGKDCPAAAGQ
ncbi:hypothetical protein [Poseidonocella sp. HB161398]|uniref:hypothetical protein n=1 Tax=Poseidonocella sp. HB161398 TaxID=2320855 RepID=UPI0011092FB9|nr:hypothetical protein [Poseidonocella sp. HB161398]